MVLGSNLGQLSMQGKHPTSSTISQVPSADILTKVPSKFIRNLLKKITFGQLGDSSGGNESQFPLDFMGKRNLSRVLKVIETLKLPKKIRI